MDSNAEEDPCLELFSRTQPFGSFPAGDPPAAPLPVSPLTFIQLCCNGKVVPKFVGRASLTSLPFFSLLSFPAHQLFLAAPRFRVFLYIQCRPSSCHRSARVDESLPSSYCPQGAGPMSLSSGLVRPPSHILSWASSSSSRAAVKKTASLPSYSASTGPATTTPIASISTTRATKALAASPTASSSAPPVSLAQKRDLAPIWFDSTYPLRDQPQGLDPKNPENERKVKLGKSMLL